MDAKISLLPYDESAIKTLIFEMTTLAISQYLAGRKTESTEAISKKRFIKGIHQLAEFLDISPARAQKLKNDGVVKGVQNGRLILFDPEQVIESFNNYNKKGRNGK